MEMSETFTVLTLPHSVYFFCTDHQTEDRQQPVCQRFQGLVTAHRHGEVQGILGPALFVYRR